jgi:hypothetical protein
MDVDPDMDIFNAIHIEGSPELQSTLRSKCEEFRDIYLRIPYPQNQRMSLRLRLRLIKSNGILIKAGAFQGSVG